MDCRQSVARLRREADAAREREDRYWTIFDKAPVGIALTKLPERTIVAANERFLRIFGYGREEVLGRTGEEVGISDPESKERIP